MCFYKKTVFKNFVNVIKFRSFLKMLKKPGLIDLSLLFCNYHCLPFCTLNYECTRCNKIFFMHYGISLVFVSFLLFLYLSFTGKYTKITFYEKLCLSKIIILKEFYYNIEQRGSIIMECNVSHKSFDPTNSNSNAL